MVKNMLNNQKKHTVIAFDFGASSGRAIKAEYDGKNLSYTEVHRFVNSAIEKDGHLCWDFPYIMGEVKKVLEKYPDIDSLAFDTWGVDYGLLDENDELISLPISYRDGRGEKAYDDILNKISPDGLYGLTGTQIMPINTLFQLAADEERAGKTLLFMPDLFAFMLCGAKTAEQTIASTSQMLDLKNVKWQKETIALTQKDMHLLPEIVESASIAGEYNGIKVIKAAGHDTQCAVAAAPFDADKTSAFLSCGTWSLIGCELDEPVLTEKSRADELSNELGANGKINYLKNISGLWLIQETRRAFGREGKDYSFNDMEQLARKAESFKCFIDPDAPEFAVPGNLPEKIKEYCKKTHQAVPETDGEVIRCIYESLAMKYRFALKQIAENTGRSFDVLHLLGGGTKDAFLCQMTADSIGFPVVAGPTEATALGNIVLQLIVLGDLKDADEGRTLIKKQEKVLTYNPENTQLWAEAYEKFCMAVIE